jgi:acylpyruvate hydrolase
MYMLYQEGDLLLTGTPSGVGPFEPSDDISCGLIDASTGQVLAELRHGVVARESGYTFKSES